MDLFGIQTETRVETQEWNLLAKYHGGSDQARRVFIDEVLEKSAERYASSLSPQEHFL